MPNEAVLFRGVNQPLPVGKRLPAGVQAWGLGPAPVTFQGPAASAAVGAVRLCLTLALDHRSETTVIVTGEDGVEFGRLAIRCGGQLQPQMLMLTGPLPQTLRLHAEGAPIWIISGDAAWEPAAPRLQWDVGAVDAVHAARRLLAEPHCLQPFGWKDGCIADALVDLHRATGEARFRQALERRLARYFPAGALRYENPRSEPCDGHFTGIESTLPVAALMRVAGSEALADQALAYWRQTSSADGVISDGAHLSTEGCYTVAWPLASIARQRGDRELAQWAVRQLQVRRARLTTAEVIHQSRTGDEPGHLTDWARGVAWYLLGSVRTSAAAQGVITLPADVLDEVRSTITRVLACQREDGLWGNFISNSDSAVDTSGSAGIATALAHAAHLGWAGSEALSAAQRASAGLGKHLTPDGWLSGCAQENKGGLALQESAYRVAAPFGLGLWGQLQAVLEAPAVAKPD